MVDVVITYVDGDKGNFKNDYNKLIKKEYNELRFRSYGVLDLQIKLIRKYMSFVDNIFVIVSDESQIPDNFDKSLCKFIYHRDIIPQKYLPTFNSCCIEMFMHKIPELNNKFIYFNDDIFCIDTLSEDDFFINDKPCLYPLTMPYNKDESIYINNLYNSTQEIANLYKTNKYKNRYIKHTHIARPFLKTTCQKVSSFCKDDILNSLTRTRHSRNFNATLFNNYDYVTNKYIYKKLNSETFNTFYDECIDCINNKSAKIICINDNDIYTDFTEFKEDLRGSLEANLYNIKYVKPIREIIIDKTEKVIEENVEYKKIQKKEISSKYEIITENNYINKDIINLLNLANFKNISVDEYLNNKDIFKEKIFEHKNIFENDYKLFIEKLKTLKEINTFGNKSYNNEKAIISLTTWKNRIVTVSKTLYNLLVQCPNFHIVLVLSEEEFPNKEEEFPEELKLFLKHNLIEILWVHKNYKAFKKILFTMNKYRNVPIISADDDCIYLYNYAEAFYNEWLNNKNSFISCWKRDIDGIVHTAGASTLYPPYVFKNLGLKCLCEEILQYTNQDDDYYTELRRELNLNTVKIIKRWNLTYYFHDEINPLHDEIKLTTKKDLHNFLKNIIDKYKKDIIISMTSYPKRINNIYTSIRLLLEKQTLMPDKIYLWLSKEEFPNKENDLPKNLIELINYNNSIILKWVDKNTYVHKRHEVFKYINDGYVFFLDDDVEYNPTLIETVVNLSKKYPNTIILYNRYSPHIYNGIKIRYKRNDDCILGGPYINKFRWCGQSMIPANIYPKEILSDEYQNIRNSTSPVSDECWFQPWVVYYNIPLYSCDFGWGKDITEDTGKKSGLVSWSHQKDENGYERRDIWLNNVLKAYPEIYKKYKQLFNYDEI